MKVLVCGSRDWEDQFIVDAVLSGLDSEREFIAVVHGAARGADTLGKKWGERRGRPRLPFPADWRPNGVYDPTAGHKRNQQMLDEGKPDICIAFKDDFNWKLDKGGTEDMVKRAKAAGVPTYVISRA
jgi:hypothetical protein